MVGLVRGKNIAQVSMAAMALFSGALGLNNSIGQKPVTNACKMRLHSGSTQDTIGVIFDWAEMEWPGECRLRKLSVGEGAHCPHLGCGGNLPYRVYSPESWNGEMVFHDHNGKWSVRWRPEYNSSDLPSSKLKFGLTWLNLKKVTFPCCMEYELENGQFFVDSAWSIHSLGQ